MAPRLLAASLVLAGTLAASASGPLTVPGSTADAAPAHGPAGGGAHCWYATAQVRVKTKYRLSSTPTEKAALRTALESCPGEAGRR
ncbi:hypothetical protein ACIP10_31145 [Streptomyces galbus]|uniref:hypothetical protein n=1 Tax=Streptomyces galbus TaxID=33898 RepID=UPI0037FF43E3